MFIDQLSKRLISILYNKEIDTRVLAQFYLIYIYKYYSLVMTIVLDYRLQFILAFQEEFCRLLGTKLKLLTVYYLQTDSQTKNTNQQINQRLCPFVNTFQDNQSSLIYQVNYIATNLLYNFTKLLPFQVKLGYQLQIDINQNRLLDIIPVIEHIYKLKKDVKVQIKQIYQVQEQYKASITKAQ